MSDNELNCRGSWQLGTACGKCPRCKRTKPSAASPAGSISDTDRMNWLISRCVEVRLPLRHGSHPLFHAQQVSDDELEPHRTSLREQIDEAIRNGN